MELSEAIALVATVQERCETATEWDAFATVVEAARQQLRRDALDAFARSERIAAETRGM